MFKNHFILVIRNLGRNTNHTLIITIGLALGMAPALMIALYVQSELSYDRFRPHSDRVYRILRETRWPSGRIQWSAGQKGTLASALREDFEEVEDATRFWAVSGWVSSGNTGFRQKFCLADENILEFFGIEVLSGNPESVLSEPSSVVLTQEMAQKYFGVRTRLGRPLRQNACTLGGWT